MAFAQLIGYGVLTLVVWKLVQRRASGKANALDVAGPEKEHWWKGNMESMVVDGFQRCLDIAADYGGAVKIHALFGEEWLYVSDPRALHHILVKEQHIFEENDGFLFCNKLIFGDGLISTLGEQHRKQRKMLNPVFSASNMRELLSVIQTISHQLKSTLVSKISACSEYDHARRRESIEFDVLPWLSRSSLDCICEGVLGYHSAALDGNEDEYTDALRMLSPSISKTMVFRPLVPIVMRNCPLYWRKKIVDWLTISWLPTQTMKNLRELRRVVEIMDSTSRAIFQEKRAALQLPSPLLQTHDTSGRTKGKDMMSIMLRANASSSEADRLSDAELLGQMNVMIFAGLETTTVAVARVLYMLAKHPHIQEQLRTEIRGAMAAYQVPDADHPHTEYDSGTRLSYDVLMNLPLLNAVVRETLRLYPSLPILTRRTTKAASVPLQFPVRSVSGEEIDAVHVAKNQRLVISIIAANHNQAVWGEDASEWKPDRWLHSSQGYILRMPRDIVIHQDSFRGRTWGQGRSEIFRRLFIYDDVPCRQSFLHVRCQFSLNLDMFSLYDNPHRGFKFAEMEIKDVLATLLPAIHFALPSEPDENGNVKEIYWKMSAFHTPVVKAPAGDGETPHLPLSMRLVRE